MCVDKYLPVLTEVVRPLKVLAAHLARERHLWTFVGALVDHQIVRLGESALTVFAHVLAFGAHFWAATKIRPAIVFDSHYSEHCDVCLSAV